jgi:hypothetical protein
MLNADQFAQHVQNVVEPVKAASASERRSGARWYGRAHRDAVHSGQDIAPGVKLQHPSGNGQLSSPAGVIARSQARAANPGTDMVDVIRDKRNSPETHRAAAEIAATSPASPSGMDWEKNSQAAFEAARITPQHYEALKTNLGHVHDSQVASGALKKAQNRGEPTAKLEGNLRAAKTAGEESGTTARAPLKGKSMAFAGNPAIASAYEIHNQIKTPEQGLSPLKTGHFGAAIKDPKGSGAAGVTVDEHMLNIIGGRVPWHSGNTPTQERDTPKVNTPKGYDYNAHVISAAADKLGMPAASAQATAWVHEKNSKSAAEGNIGPSKQDRARSTINRNVSNRLVGEMRK